MYATFQARAEAVSAEVLRFSGRAQAVHFVETLLLHEGVADRPGARAVWSDRGHVPPEEREALCRRVPGLAFEVTRERAAQARVGVSEFDYAVANTGTLASAADAVAERLAGTLPEVHVALADPARLVPDLPALLAVLGPSRTRYLSLVTGPSRTADIERVLTIGVHGPRRLVIAFVDGLQGRA
jgi:L-lactate dehydrogenase complex protein LldG